MKQYPHLFRKTIRLQYVYHNTFEVITSTESNIFIHIFNHLFIPELDTLEIENAARQEYVKSLNEFQEVFENYN